MRRTWRFDGRTGRLVEVASTSALRSRGPAVRREIDPYVSPTTGRLIETHRARREDLKRSGCIDARELKGERLANGKRHKG